MRAIPTLTWRILFWRVRALDALSLKEDVWPRTAHREVQAGCQGFSVAREPWKGAFLW